MVASTAAVALGAGVSRRDSRRRTRAAGGSACLTQARLVAFENRPLLILRGLSSNGGPIAETSSKPSRRGYINLTCLWRDLSGTRVRMLQFERPNCEVVHIVTFGQGTNLPDRPSRRKRRFSRKGNKMTR